MYSPAMKYVLPGLAVDKEELQNILPALAVDEEELQNIQTKVLSAMLQKLGYSSETPTAVRHGPIE